jgi:hypothetical protein
MGNRRSHTWNELTAAWRNSDRKLAAECDPHRILVLVIVRAGILDEMEREDARAFSAWLAEPASQRSPQGQGSSA